MLAKRALTWWDIFLGMTQYSFMLSQYKVVQRFHVTYGSPQDNAYTIWKGGSSPVVELSTTATLQTWTEPS